MSEPINAAEVTHDHRKTLRYLRMLMFAHFFGMGAVAPMLNVYLQDQLQFSGAQAGFIMGLMPAGMIVGSFINVLLTDRVLRAEHLYMTLKIITAIAAIVMCFMHTFVGVAITFGVYAFAFAPSGAVKESLCFHRMPPHQRDDYGNVRVFTTFGWITAGWLVPFAFGAIAETRVPLNFFQCAFILVALSAAFNCMLTFKLPPRMGTFKRRPIRSEIIPKGTFHVFRNPAVILLTVCGFASGFMDRFYFFSMGPYLKSMGISNEQILPLMTLGQALEIFGLFALGGLLRRFGFRKIMLMGACFHVLRFSLLAFGQNLPTAALGILMHGGAYALYFVPSMMCFDRLCPREHLSGAFLVFSVIAMGFSGLASNLIGGLLFDADPGFLVIWVAPLLASLIPFICALLQMGKFPVAWSFSRQTVGSIQ
jgi:predicted MFS family arabinose efflux permease